jgi:alcohol dehydrogenase
MTDGLGADVVIEAVGVPETFEMCTSLVRPGGHVANVGVHGRPAALHLESLWIKEVTITTGLVHTNTTPTQLSMVASGTLDAGRFATHQFALDDIEQAYDVFARASETNALKVMLTR